MESRHVAFIILFVKSVERTSLTCIFGVKELYLKMCELYILACFRKGNMGKLDPTWSRDTMV